jgi:hypothetical protein
MPSLRSGVGADRITETNVTAHRKGIEKAALFVEESTVVHIGAIAPHTRYQITVGIPLTFYYALTQPACL